MSNQTLTKLFTPPLWEYDKKKVNVLKAVLAVVIILHHIYNEGYYDLAFIGSKGGNIAMYLFFAMSGYGLTISYIRKQSYIYGFLQRSLTKLFVPYVLALTAFVVYRQIEGIDQVALFKEKGLFSFVPTSWFIWILSYFYIFFFVSFRYVKSGNLTKVLVTCALVMAYVLIAPHVGIGLHRYSRCPAFCAGMFFALYDGAIRTKFVRWHALVSLLVLIAFFCQPHGHRLDPVLYPVALFALMYLIKDVKEYGTVKFLSSISMEMFIIQYLPISVAVNDLHLTNTIAVVAFVLSADILIAYMMHISVKNIQRILPWK